MLKINFKIDENVLAKEIISQSAMPVAFANYLWEKYKSSYIVLQNQPNINDNDIDCNIILELKQEKFFQNNLKEAKENLLRIKQNWNKKEKLINDFLLKILKTDINLNMTCYIVSTSLHCGHNIGNNSFVWGHPKGIEDANYDLVYLVHESLHSFFDKDNLSHTIIEEISDIELSKLLNNTNNGYKHHTYTTENHIKIFPFWNIYLNRSCEDINLEQKYRNIKYKINNFEKYRNEISKMDILHFLDFVKNKINNVNFTTIYTIK